MTIIRLSVTQCSLQRNFVVISRNFALRIMEQLFAVGGGCSTEGRASLSRGGGRAARRAQPGVVSRYAGTAWVGDVTWLHSSPRRAASATGVVVLCSSQKPAIKLRRWLLQRCPTSVEIQYVTTVQTVVLGFNHKPHNAAVYQLSAKSDNRRLSYLWLNKYSRPIFIRGSNFLLPYFQR